MAVVQKKKNIDQKAKTIKQIEELHRNYKFLVIVDSDNIKSELIHELRNKIASNSKILFGKKKIMFKALQKKNVQINKKYVNDNKENSNPDDFTTKNSTIFLIFTNDTNISEYLNIKIKGYLKTGDTCKEDVFIQPGALKIGEQYVNVDMNSKLNACDLPCYVKDGKVVIDTLYTIAEKETKINNKQAKLLRLLGYKMAELKVNILEIIKLQ